MTASPALNAIGLVVADIPRAIEFYHRLGLTFAEPEGGHTSAELAGGIKLMLDTEELMRSISDEWTPPSGHPRVTLAFECATPAAVDAKFAELVAAGAPAIRKPWDAFWGQRYATVLDPDGNEVALYANLPSS